MRRILALLTVAYVLIGMVGGFVAVNRVLPARVPEPQPTVGIAQEALFGWGTALSAPGGLLVAALLLAIAATSAGNGGRLAAGALVLVGVAGVAKGIAEPVTRAALQDWSSDPLVAFVALASVSLSALIVVISLAVVAADAGQSRRY